MTLLSLLFENMTLLSLLFENMTLLSLFPVSATEVNNVCQCYSSHTAHSLCLFNVSQLVSNLSIGHHQANYTDNSPDDLYSRLKLVARK
jgi:hypothetical protein